MRKALLTATLLIVSAVSLYATTDPAMMGPGMEGHMMRRGKPGRGKMVRRNKDVMKAMRRLHMLKQEDVSGELKSAVSTFKDAIKAKEKAAEQFLKSTDDNETVKNIEETAKEQRKEMRKKKKSKGKDRGKKGGERGKKKGWFKRMFGKDDSDAEVESEEQED
ncbi:hypothetical protein KAU11_04760 [Candidatus Babeliales bacterium]|nr:hypothetical protein [Candidatus Babeliales bacterium]